MLILFIVLFFGPLIIKKFLFKDGMQSINVMGGDFMQPTGQDNNDTLTSETGTGSDDYVQPTPIERRMFYY